ncbi:hypothetical protein OPV22_031002 [Ensete ventricosum]|uniref:Exocyst subunit Exo70 family protein n=1 Tax=Ensete ventricosum TaxID=4639 RepID=A0AAV8P0W5_ENSVE|nr:hypothetical protein OPV22_031002 [Ensete ventricosum]
MQKEPSRKPIQGSEIHPMTRYVMNYVKLLVVYINTLNILLDDGGVCGTDEGSSEGWDNKNTGGVNLENMTPLGRHMLLIISYLESNLDEKSKVYEDGAMRQLRQYATSYLRTSWTKVLSCLKDDGYGSGSSSSISKVALKEKFKNFNMAFEEIYRVQTTWKVPDPQLREELRISISEKVIPAYRSFMGSLQDDI